MTSTTAAPSTPGRMTRLLGFLQADPDNASLLGDAASAAYDEGHAEEAAELLDRLARRGPLSPALMNLKGLVAMRLGDAVAAREVFSTLAAQSPGEPTVRLNLAWSQSLLGHDEEAAALLDDEAVHASPQGALLKAHTLHRLGRLDEALEFGLEQDAEGRATVDLLGALSAVAMDADNAELARDLAGRAAGNSEAESTLGMLDLNAGDTAAALAHFDAAINGRHDNARAILGHGLALLQQARAGEALPWIDRAADLFGTHLGSWVAAGWAALAAGDRPAARARFERALAVDDTFAETHGALAVLSFLDGDLAAAERGAEIALRLDRNCFSGALVRSLLLDAKGQTRAAQKIVELAMSTPFGGDGQTLARMLAAMGGRAGRR